VGVGAAGMGSGCPQARASKNTHSDRSRRPMPVSTIVTPRLGRRFESRRSLDTTGSARQLYVTLIASIS
jgi:hypothetical protein